MRRSRTTLATIEAAAMVALVASPRTISSCTGAPAPSSRRPSTRRSSARSPRARSDRSRQAMFGGIDPDPVVLARGDIDERDRLRVAEDGPGETLALGTRKTLRVVQLLEKTPTRAGGEPLKVEEDPRGHDRAGQAGAPHLVDACDQANATSTIVGKEGRVAHGVRLFKAHRESAVVVEASRMRRAGSTPRWRTCSS